MCNSENMLLGIYPKELKTYVHTKICTQLFIATLFVIVKTWKKLRCPELGEQINKLWYIHMIAPERMKRGSQSENNAQVWM